MRNLAELDKKLLQSEFQDAVKLYDKARAEGYSEVKAVALIYRHGRIDGASERQGQLKALHKRHNLLVTEYNALLAESGSKEETEITDNGGSKNV